MLSRLVVVSFKPFQSLVNLKYSYSLAILGATNPLASTPGTIRGDYAIDVGRNVCHGSDAVDSAKKEIALWFSEGDVVSYKAASFDWVYEKA